MRGLPDLPYELLLMIFEGFGSSKSDLHSMTLLCKKSNAVATSLLYETVVFSSDFQSARHFKPFLNFASLICKSPAHARMVKSWGSECPHESLVSMSDPLLKEVARAIAQKIKDMMPTEQLQKACTKFLNSDDELKNSSVLFLFVPMLLPALNRLLYVVDFSIGQLPDQLHLLIDALQESDIGEAYPPFWSTLTEVTLQGAQDKWPDSTSPLSAFARLPWLKRIDAVAFADFHGCHPDPEPEKCDEGFGFDSLAKDTATALEYLSILPRSLLKGPHMYRLLQAPKALRTFKYNIGHNGAWTPFKTTDLLQALRHQAHSLQHITITHGWLQEGNGTFRLVHEHMAPMSFKDFRSLQTLEIAAPFIFGNLFYDFRDGYDFTSLQDPWTSGKTFNNVKTHLVEMLPESIVTLRFSQCCDVEVVRCLRIGLNYLFESCRAEYKNLKTVEFHTYHRDSDSSEYRTLVYGFQKLSAEVESVRTKASSLDIDVRAFNGGVLGTDSPEEGRRIHCTLTINPPQPLEMVAEQIAEDLIDFEEWESY